jgi:hypothetical protein
MSEKGVELVNKSESKRLEDSVYTMAPKMPKESLRIKAKSRAQIIGDRKLLSGRECYIIVGT